MTPKSPCPVPHCDGTILILGLADKSRTYFACDATTTHHDYDIRLAYEKASTADQDDIRSEMSAIERRLHLVAWIRARVEDAMRKSDIGITRSLPSAHVIPPPWPPGTIDGPHLGVCAAERD